jgi:FkbM family methyltransferase
VLALEPNPRTFASLRRQIDRNGVGVEAVEAAAGREPGSAELYTSAFSSGVSSLRPEWASQYRASASAPLKIRVVTLDGLAAQRGWSVVDWLLIDAEGSEAEILEGARGTLGLTRKVIVEVAHGEVADRCERLLETAGFTILERAPQNAVNSYWLAAR